MIYARKEFNSIEEKENWILTAKKRKFLTGVNEELTARFSAEHPRGSAGFIIPGVSTSGYEDGLSNVWSLALSVDNKKFVNERNSILCAGMLFKENGVDVYETLEDNFLLGAEVTEVEGDTNDSDTYVYLGPLIDELDCHMYFKPNFEYVYGYTLRNSGDFILTWYRGKHRKVDDLSAQQVNEIRCPFVQDARYLSTNLRKYYEEHGQLALMRKLEVSFKFY